MPTASPAPLPPLSSEGLTQEQLEAAQILATHLGAKLRALPSTALEDATAPRANPRFSPQDLFAFAHSTFYVPETGRPIRLEPVQQSILTCALSSSFATQVGCPDGFQTIIYSTVKKSGKTTVASLVARWIAERWGGNNEVYMVANDLDQSRGLLYDKFLKSLQLDPRFDRAKDEIPGYWDIVRRDATHTPSGSTIRPLSGDYKGQAGMNPTATFWSELWGYTLEGSQRLWDELTPVPTRARSIRWVETYAGFVGESLLLIEQYELGTRPERGARQLTRDDVPDWPGPETHLLPMYVNPQARQFTYWDEGEVARRMPWQTPRYYQAQATQLRPEAFDRFHNNHWVSSTASFLPTEWWDNCRVTSDDVPASAQELDTDTPVVIAADASVSGDCSAAVIVSRSPTNKEKILVRRSALWTPPAGGALNYSLTIEPTLRKWISGHIHPLNQPCDAHDYVDQLGVCVPVPKLNVLQLAYDMYQLHDMMSRFKNEGLVWVYSFGQGGDRLVADHLLYTYIRDRRILHFGDDDIREHISHAAAKIARDSNTKMRLVKKATSSKIDLAVATSMATHECVRLNMD